MTKRPEILRFEKNGWVPNSRLLPVLVYRAAIDIRGDDPAENFETLFEKHGWKPDWRDKIFRYHHYHSTAHEVLGFASGSAMLVLGGPSGTEIAVHAGDVALLPAGTGHRQRWASPDFLTVGAYPPRQKWDIRRTAPTPKMLEKMEALPFPASDPVSGRGGPMTRLWQRA